MGLKGIAPPLAVESEGRSKPYKTEYLRCNFSVKKVYEEMDSFIVYNFPKLMNKYRILYLHSPGMLMCYQPQSPLWCAKTNISPCYISFFVHSKKSCICTWGKMSWNYLRFETSSLKQKRLYGKASQLTWDLILWEFWFIKTFPLRQQKSHLCSLCLVFCFLFTVNKDMTESAKPSPSQCNPQPL